MLDGSRFWSDRPLDRHGAPVPAVIWFCRPGGELVEMVRDDFQACAGRVLPMALAELLDPADREKCHSLLAIAGDAGSVFDWPITVRVGDQPVRLHFAAARAGERILLVAAATRTDLSSVFEHLRARDPPVELDLRSNIDAIVLQAHDRPDLTTGLIDQISQLNGELVSARRELAQKNAEIGILCKEKSLWVSIAAHELRSPLSVILSHCGFLEADPDNTLTEDHRRLLGIINGNGLFAAQLIDELLDLSAIEAGHLLLKLEPTNLEELVLYKIDFNRPRADAKQTQLVARLESGLPPILLDRAKINVVLNNLIGNAIKFSPAESTVTVGSRSRGDWLEILVEDDGPGIDPQFMGELFRPFRSRKVAGAGEEKSTGLGLAISARIVEAHGGKIWAESKLGHGSTFYFSLPTKPQKGQEWQT